MSAGEIIFIVFVALMLFGSEKIPEIARGLGKGMREIKDATNQIKQEINKSAKDTGIEQKVEEVKKEVEKIKQELDPVGGIKREG